MIVDPDGAEQGADDDRDAREVHLVAELRRHVVRQDHPRPDLRRDRRHHPAHASNGSCSRPTGPRPRTASAASRLILDLERTPAQRRADALVEMATRARTAPADGRRPAPLFTVVVGLETFVGPILELFNRTVLTPGTAARYLTEADVERIVFDGPSRVLDVGAQRRFFRGALRRAIEVRDRTCFHPSCDEVPAATRDHLRSLGLHADAAVDADASRRSCSCSTAARPPSTANSSAVPRRSGKSTSRLSFSLKASEPSPWP